MAAAVVTSDRRLLVKFFLTCWIIYATHWAPFIVREHFPAMTLAERGTLNVEPFLGWTEDIFPGPHGGAYINNNPGASLVGAIPLLLARPALDAVSRWNARQPRPPVVDKVSPIYARAVAERREWHFLAVAFATQAGVMAPLSALAGTLFAAALLSSGVPRRRAYVAALVFAFGTPIFLRTTYLNHNLLVAHAGLFGFLLLHRRGTAVWRAAVAGLLGGFAVLCDLSGMIVAGALGVYVWLGASDQESPRRGGLLAAYVVGVAPGLIALMVYQHVGFGHPVMPSQHYMTATAPTVHGYRGFDWPSFQLAWANFFDGRFGLFAYCPLLAAGLAAPFVRNGPFRVPSREAALILAFFAAFVLFCAANRYSVLQWSTGVRYLVPVIPGLLVLSLQALQALPGPVLAVLVAGTVLTNWFFAATFQRPAALVEGSLGRLELSWIQRLVDLGLWQPPGGVSLVVLLFLAALVCAIWARELSGRRPAEQAELGIAHRH